MQNNEFYFTTTFLKEKDLKVGNIYCAKDGRLMLYIGQTELANYIFYEICSALYTYESSTASFRNYNIQVPALISMCQSAVTKPIYRESVRTLKSVPALHVSFPFVIYKPEDITNWYTRNMFMNSDLPKLYIHKKNGTKNSAPNPYVSSKDLVPGHLYYTGSCWRGVYVFLGRTVDKRYAWYFVGNTEMLVSMTAYELLHRAETTSTNKKVKPLAMALQDPKAYLSADIKHLIDINYKVDMRGVSQPLL